MAKNLIYELEKEIEIIWNKIEKLYFDGFLLGREIDLHACLYYFLQKRLLKKHEKIRVVGQYPISYKISENEKEGGKIDLCVIQFTNNIDYNRDYLEQEHKCLIGIEIKKGKFIEEGKGKWKTDYTKLRRFREKKSIEMGYFAFIETSGFSDFGDESYNCGLLINAKEVDYEFYREAQGGCEKRQWKIVKPDEVHKRIMIKDKIDDLMVESDKLIKKGHCQKALKCCDEILKLEPANSIALFDKGRVFLKLRKYEKALRFFDKCKIDKLGPKEKIIAWKYKGDALLKLRRKKEAKECYDKAKELKKD